MSRRWEKSERERLGLDRAREGLVGILVDLGRLDDGRATSPLEFVEDTFTALGYDDFSLKYVQGRKGEKKARRSEDKESSTRVETDFHLLRLLLFFWRMTGAKH